jgi:hypothetical protein
MPAYIQYVPYITLSAAFFADDIVKAVPLYKGTVPLFGTKTIQCHRLIGLSKNDKDL